jgi:LmbE family N-acetylglucosaminyl deacetylase
MARSTGLGVEVTVLICSAGEASHPRSRTHSPDRLASMRRAEAAAAVASLAPTAKVELLDLPDGRLTGVPDVLTAEILRRGGRGGRGSWLVVPWRNDHHPDHAAVSAAAQRAADGTGSRLLEYPN